MLPCFSSAFYSLTSLQSAVCGIVNRLMQRLGSGGKMYRLREDEREGMHLVRILSFAVHTVDACAALVCTCSAASSFAFSILSASFFAVKLVRAARKIRKLALPQEIAGNTVSLPNKRFGYEKDIRCSTGTFRVPVSRSRTCVVRRGRQWRRGRGRKRRCKPVSHEMVDLVLPSGRL